MNTTRKEKILGKLAKLLDLVNHDGTPENERAVAEAQIQSILAKYNLTLEDAQREKFVTTALDLNTRKDGDWTVHLRNYIYRLHGVLLIKTHERDERNQRVYKITGRESDVTVAKYVIDVISAQIVKASEKYRRKHNLRRNSRVLRDFQMTAALTAARNYEELIKDVKVTDSVTGKDLVLVDEGERKLKEAIKEYINRFGGLRKRSLQGRAYNAAGAKVHALTA